MPTVPRNRCMRMLAANCAPILAAVKLVSTNLIEVEHQIQFADVPEERVQHLDEKVDGLEVGELVVVGVDACTEEQPCVSAIHDLGSIPELDKVGLVLLVARRNQAVDLA